MQTVTVEAYKDQKNKRYSQEAKNAVRYGYQYRAAAKKYTTHFICWLPELPGVFCWLAERVFDEIAFDFFKGLVADTYAHLKRHRKKIEPSSKRFFTDPEEIRRFYDYVKEFKEKKMNLEGKDRTIIAEGIIADYTKKAAEKIYDSMGRFPTTEEYERIQRDAHQAVEAILSDRVLPNKNR